MSDSADNQGNGKTSQLAVADLKTVSDAIAAAVKRAAFTRPSLPRAEVLAAAVRAAKPGTERWPVKTGTDLDVGRVGQNDFAGADNAGIVDTTVEELIEIPRPAEMADIQGFQDDYQEKRAEPVELVIWRLEADITVLKKEADGDLHLVLQGNSGRTMIAEAPTPRSPFVKTTSPWLDAMRSVRERLVEHFGQSFQGVTFQPLDTKFVMPVAIIVKPPASALPVGPSVIAAFEALPPFEAKVPRTSVKITGVGFFDRVHGQTGVALKNGIELHPILDVQFN